jgi:hypothetical protein
MGSNNSCCKNDLTIEKRQELDIQIQYVEDINFDTNKTIFNSNRVKINKNIRIKY